MPVNTKRYPDEIKWTEMCTSIFLNLCGYIIMILSNPTRKMPAEDMLSTSKALQYHSTVVGPTCSMILILLNYTYNLQLY